MAREDGHVLGGRASLAATTRAAAGGGGIGLVSEHFKGERSLRVDEAEKSRELGAEQRRRQMRKRGADCKRGTGANKNSKWEGILLPNQ